MSDSASMLHNTSGQNDLAGLLDALRHGQAADGNPLLERPMLGTTLYLAECDLETRFGPFRATIFQDIIDKHYVLALAHGDIHAAGPLYTRLHSSCVTSETLGGCDCDCGQQLEGAFKVIAAKGRGILFYLMQEGRGVGYVGKSRDRMLVQASLDQISTFQAYQALGLKKDHRHYDNISDICTLLGIAPEFVVLTNNPDKIEAMHAQGLKVVGTETLEFEPGPFNLAYLTSKADGGHILRQPAISELRRALPPEPVVPFNPHALAGAMRFIHTASYFLPIRPVDNEVVLSGEQFAQIPAGHPLMNGHRAIGAGRVLVSVDCTELVTHRRQHPEDPVAGLLSTPYWFRVHVYYDLVTSQEFVVLVHGKPEANPVPVVRLHSDSLFNRFPLCTTASRDKLQQSVKHIVEHGHGLLLLLHNDGRGAGFGAFATDQMMTQRGEAGSTDEAYKKIGVGYDSRDYDASMLLLRQHLAHGRIHMVMNSPESLVRKPEYAEALHRHGIDVEQWIFLGAGRDEE
ncbi:MAG: GTP cyclohydrolase [Verrucomicrobiota bacterium]